MTEVDAVGLPDRMGISPGRDRDADSGDSVARDKVGLAVDSARPLIPS